MKSYNTKELRKLYRFTQRELSEKFNIPLGTIRNWDSRNCMPSYVYAMITKILIYESNLNYQHELISRYYSDSIGKNQEIKKYMEKIQLLRDEIKDLKRK